MRIPLDVLAELPLLWSEDTVHASPGLRVVDDGPPALAALGDPVRFPAGPLPEVLDFETENLEGDADAMFELDRLRSLHPGQRGKRRDDGRHVGRDCLRRHDEPRERRFVRQPHRDQQITQAGRSLEPLSGERLLAGEHRRAGARVAHRATGRVRVEVHRDLGRLWVAIRDRVDHDEMGAQCHARLHRQDVAVTRRAERRREEPTLLGEVTELRAAPGLAHAPQGDASSLDPRARDHRDRRPLREGCGRDGEHGGGDPDHQEHARLHGILPFQACPSYAPSHATVPELRARD